MESYAARAKRLTPKLISEAAAAGFSNSEAEDEWERIAPLVQAAVDGTRDRDVDTYVLKSQLTRENEDGD